LSLGIGEARNRMKSCDKSPLKETFKDRYREFGLLTTCPNTR
jgi:hypothetical protein